VTGDTEYNATQYLRRKEIDFLVFTKQKTKTKKLFVDMKAHWRFD